MTTGDLSGDLAWWRANRNSPAADAAAMRALLARLQAWKATHDADRTGQPGPFLQMVWDAIFGDENDQVEAAIAQLEAALSSSDDP